MLLRYKNNSIKKLIKNNFKIFKFIFLNYIIYIIFSTTIISEIIYKYQLNFAELGFFICLH